VLVIRCRATLHAAAKLSGVEHGLPDHLEDVPLKDMGRDFGVPAAFDHDFAFRQMPVAHQPLAASIGELVGMTTEEGGNLRP